MKIKKKNLFKIILTLDKVDLMKKSLLNYFYINWVVKLI